MTEKITPSSIYVNGDNPNEEHELMSLVELQKKDLLRSFVVEYLGDANSFKESIISDGSLALEDEPTEDDLANLDSEFNLDFNEDLGVVKNVEFTNDRDVTTTEYFLSQLANHKLLTREEEITLSNAVQKGILAQTVLENNQDIDLETRNKLQNDIVQGKIATSEMARCNAKLVISVAKQHHGMQLEDKIQEGQIGLLTAIQKFDPTKGFAFSTYATWWIRQAISRAIHDKSRPIRIPVHASELLNKSNRATYVFNQEYGRQPTVEELEEFLTSQYGASKAHINLLRSMRLRGVDKSIISLEAPINSDKESELGEFIPNKDEDILEATVSQLNIDELESLLEDLTPRQQYIIKNRFFQSRKVTLEELGEKYGRTRERIRQVEVDALKRLKPRLAELQERKKNANGLLSHEMNHRKYEDIVEDVLPTFDPLVATILYKRLYLYLDNKQVAAEVDKDAEEVEQYYAKGRIQIWDLLNNGSFSDTLRLNTQQLKDLNIQRLKRMYQTYGHLLNDEQISSFELFFGYESNKGLSIRKIAQDLGKKDTTIQADLKSAVILLEGLILNKRAI